MPEIWLPGTRVLTYPLHFRHLAFLVLRVLLASTGTVLQQRGIVPMSPHLTRGPVVLWDYNKSVDGRECFQALPKPFVLPRRSFVLRLLPFSLPCSREYSEIWGKGMVREPGYRGLHLWNISILIHMFVPAGLFSQLLKVGGRGVRDTNKSCERPLQCFSFSFPNILEKEITSTYLHKCPK